MSTGELTSVVGADAARDEDTPDDRLDLKLVLTAMVIVLATSLAIIDTTVVNVAVSTIERHFHAPLSTIQWIVTGYTLALGVVIPLTGWFAERFGTKQLLMGSIAFFVLGSALAGLAWSDSALIAARVIQGFGGGMLAPAGMTILTHAAGPKRLGRVMAFVGVPMLVAPIMGPVLGGWLVDTLSWRWIFYINLPLGGIALLLCQKVLDSHPGSREFALDWLGLALLVPGLALPTFGVVSADVAGGLMHVQVIAPIVVGALALWRFINHSLKVDNALIDPRVFHNRTFSAATGTLFLGLVPAFGTFLLLPLYLQTVRGESALHTGMLLIPIGIGAAIVMPIAGILADRVAVGFIVPLGMFVAGAGFLGLTQLQAHTSFVFLGFDFAVIGGGVAAVMVPMFTGTMQTLRKEQVARASTTLGITQQAGAAIGTALLTGILAHELLLRHLGSGRTVSSGTAFTGARAVAAAHAFSATFTAVLPLLVLAFLVSVVFLPKKVHVHAEGEVEDGVPASVLLG